MRKTFQYRATINRETEAQCLQWLQLCRTLYNAALEQRIFAYRQYKRSITAVAQKNELPELKRDLPEFQCVGSQVLQDVIERLDRAYRAFFRRVKQGEKPGFPRFRGANRYDSFTLKQAGWMLDGRYLYIRNLGRFKLFFSRPIEGQIKTVTIRRVPTGKWYVSFSCDEVPTISLPVSERSVGIDVGITTFLTDSHGHTVANPKFFRASERMLQVAQRSLSRKQRASTRRVKAKHAVATIHEKIANQRKDFIHKVALSYVRQYQTIAVEDLNIKGMVKNRHLAKSISDAAWGMFVNVLYAKAVWAGRQVVTINPCNTSQQCSECGRMAPKSLAVRLHCCPHCGIVLDRDHNAALNIARLGGALRADAKLRVA